MKFRTFGAKYFIENYGHYKYNIYFRIIRKRKL